jgi:predicted  nucleic acid-binding Zn-ribbon protein
MKRQVIVAVVVAAALLGSTHAGLADETRSRSDAGKETREALAAYRRALERELQQLDRRAEELEQRAKAAMKDLQPEAKQRLERLREEHAAARRQLNRLGDEAAQLWDGLKNRMDAVVDDLRRRYDDTSGTL